MDVSGVGSGPTGAEFSSALRALAGPKPPGLDALAGVAHSGDASTSLLGELSELELVSLLQIFDRRLTPDIAARVDGLLRASVSAVAEGNVAQALLKLTEIATLDPRRAETLGTEPGLAAIRPDVGRLLFRLASTARLDAEARLEQATHLGQTARPNELDGEVTGKLAGQAVRPEIAILIAGRLLEAGGYVNCVHSAELSRVLISQYGWVPAPVPTPLMELTSSPIRRAHASLDLLRRWTPWMKRLWLRAPLLFLLLAWFAVGVAVGSISAVIRNYWPQICPQPAVALGFEIWGVGFLALILFALYASVRYPRR